MKLLDKVKELFNKKEQNQESKQKLHRISVAAMEKKFETDDIVGAAKDLKILLEIYGFKKKKNHRYKGREFIYFILNNKHKDLKTTGYKHWQNINKIIQLNHQTSYPYHKSNLQSAIDFFKKEIKGINTIDTQIS